jgi:short subunit dehydrogenase-like uncharacterized protein
MREFRFLIYGATGYSGRLIAEEAVRRGHRPLVAGRSAEKLRLLESTLGLPTQVLSLDDPAGLRAATARVDLVLHAAGPFVETARPLRDACLDTGTSYADITGEIPVFEDSFAADARARRAGERGVALMSGVGFDVVPTDCLARHVAEAVESPTRLELGILGIGQPSSGTALSALEGLPRGNHVRRGGQLVPVPMGHDARQLRFPSGERTVMAVPWGDLSTAYRTTGIGDIVTYMAFSPGQVALTRHAGPVLRRVLSVDPLRALAARLVQQLVSSPDEAATQSGRAELWARASNDRGQSRQAWMVTIDGYRFTAQAAVRCVERLLEDRPVGALTPAGAFGADFALEIEGTRRAAFAEALTGAAGHAGAAL